MSLVVSTARLSRARDVDALDITRLTADRARRDGAMSPGEPFAPSWAILGPALRARKAAAHWRKTADAAWATSDLVATMAIAAAKEVEETAWALYEPAYIGEMRESYRQNRAAWVSLLARPRVVLACFCTEHTRCHRSLLARILVSCGASYDGEIQSKDER